MSEVGYSSLIEVLFKEQPAKVKEDLKKKKKTDWKKLEKEAK